MILELGQDETSGEVVDRMKGHSDFRERDAVDRGGIV